MGAYILHVGPSSVWVTAIKRAEKGEGIIVRLQERSGNVTEAAVDVPMLRANHKVSLKPWEIKTLLITSATGQRRSVKEVNLLER